MVTPYGSGCGGAELGAHTDFVVPGTHVLELTAPAPIAAALFGFGFRRQSIPFPPSCTILNDLVFVLPPQVSQATATLRIRPPAISGLVFQVQGAAALASGPLLFSNGIELRCP